MMERRREVPPRASFEELEIRTSDSASLRATIDEPTGPIRATVVLAHALFARRSSFGGTAAALAARGYRVIAFDFRAHGGSAARATGYDLLVESDWPTVVQCARDRADGKPVIAVGHSLGAHTALASQGRGLLAADGIVSIGGAPWIRSAEGSLGKWLAKRGILRTMTEVARRKGRYPARALRTSSDDESLDMMEDLNRFAEQSWSSRGGVDYLAALAKVRVPVVSLAGGRDRICTPANAAAFVSGCGGAVTYLVIEGAAHMKLAKLDGPIASAIDHVLG